jgi:hypothetical protein
MHQGYDVTETQGPGKVQLWIAGLAHACDAWCLHTVFPQLSVAANELKGGWADVLMRFMSIFLEPFFCSVFG